MKLILGKLNNGAIFYWDISHMQLKPSVGDYAIVENMNGYDLIKVAGIVTTTKANASKFSNTKYGNMKNIIQIT